MPSLLMPAIPFVFVTNELHVLSSATLQSGQHPPSIHITKYFSKSQIAAVKQEFEEVKAMDSAAVEEWLKGLDDRGKSHRRDAGRWEKLEVGGGLGRMRDISFEASDPDGSGTISVPIPTTTPAGLRPNSSLPPHPGFSTFQPNGFTANHSAQLPQPIHNTFGESIPKHEMARY
jgi:hypothetical protein